MSHKSTRNRISISISISRLPAKSYHRRLRAMRRKIEQDQIDAITNRLIGAAPPKGYELWRGVTPIHFLHQADYAQMETRMMAAFANSVSVQNPVTSGKFPETKQYTPKR